MTGTGGESSCALEVVVAKGAPSDAELAALLSVLAAANAARVPSLGPPRRDTARAWSDPRRQLVRRRQFRARLSRWGDPAPRTR